MTQAYQLGLRDEARAQVKRIEAQLANTAAPVTVRPHGSHCFWLVGCSTSARCRDWAPAVQFMA